MRKTLQNRFYHKFIIFILLISLFTTAILLSARYFYTDNGKNLTNFIPDRQFELVSSNDGIVMDGNEPNINGTILPSEWQDAKILDMIDERGWMIVYILRNSTHLFFAVEVYDTDSGGTEFLVLFFDEGDDGSYGSGSWDHEFSENQDDCKAIYDDGSLFDGTFDNAGMPVYSSSLVDFQGVVNYYTDHFEFELVIPLVGVDGRSVDYSDLNISLNDIIGFNMYYSNTFQSTNLIGTNVFAPTYINVTSMEIGTGKSFDIGIVADGYEPDINGTLLSSEWNNALYFPYMDSMGLAEIYLLRNSSHLMIGASFLDTVYSEDDQMIIIFDEGDDGTYGSGSRDGILTNFQEDYKVLKDTQLWDGYYDGSFQTFVSDLDFVGFMEYYGDHWEVELSMPLIGFEGRVDEYSDLNASIIDEIGLFIQITNYTSGNTQFPSHATDPYNPRYYLKLKMGHLYGLQSDTINYQTGRNGKVWLNGSAYTDLGNLSLISVYAPSSDTTNATGVTWSMNQGTNESWAFYNTSNIPSGRYWTKINISNDQEPAIASYINLTVEYCVDFIPPTGNQAPSNNASNPQNGGIDNKYWIRGTAADSLSGLLNVSVYDPAPDTTNATGVTWSANQGNLSSWEFYNTSGISEGIYWIKIKIEDKLGNYYNLTTIVSFEPNNPPILSDETLIPSSGNVSTVYNFTVNYTDFDNDPPTYLYLSLNQNNISMTKLNASDNDYTDGVVYTYQTLLGRGNYSVGYYTSDGLAHVNHSTSQIISNEKLISSSGLVVIPTIDGDYDVASEWSDATFIYNPSAPLIYYLYIKNDQTNLYLLLDFIEDVGTHVTYDFVAYYFDVQNDDFLTANGEAKIYHNLANTLKLKWYWNGIAWLNNDSSSDVGVDSHASFSSSVNSPSAHSIYECKIPLDYLNVNPGETIGFGVCISNLNPGATTDYFPTDFIENNPITYSDLLLNVTLSYPEINLTSPLNQTYSVNSIPIICENQTEVANVWVRNRTGGSWSNNVSLQYNGSHWVNGTALTWSDGFYELQIFANDSIGTETNLVKFFTIDTKHPLISISTPTNGALLTGLNTWINGTVNSTGSTIRQMTINSSDFEIVTDPTNASTGVFSFRNKTIVLGNYTLTVTVVDDAGLMNSTMVSFTVDNLAPILTLIEPTASVVSGPVWFNGTVSGTGSKLTLYYNDSRFSPIFNPNGTLSGFFALVNNTNISDGNFTLNLTVVDQAGLKFDELKSILVDNKIPAIVITNIVNGSLTTGSTIWINGTVNATGSWISGLLINDTTNFDFQSSPIGQGEGSFSIWNVTKLPDGLFSLTINVSDAAGNTNFISIWFSVDNLVPELNCSNLRYAGDAQGNNVIEFSGFANGTVSSILNLTINDPRFNLADDPRGTIFGYYRFVNTTFIPEGFLNVTLNISDEVGHYSLLNLSCIVDLTPPSAPATLDSSVVGNNVLLSWSEVIDLTNVTYLIFRNGVNIINVSEITYQDSNLPPDTYTYRVYTIDNAGHVSGTFTSTEATVKASGLDLTWILLLLGIIGSTIAVTASVFLYRRKKQKVPITRILNKEDRAWLDGALGYTTKLDETLSALLQKPQKFDEIQDPTLAQLLKKSFTVLPPSYLDQLEHLSIPDHDKVEILNAILLLPIEQREEFMHELTEEKNKDS